MQIAYELQLNISDSIFTLEFQSNLMRCFQDRTVKKYKRFPEVLTKTIYNSFVTDLDADPESEKCSISVGLDYTDCKPVTIDFSSSRAVAIYGKKGFGKTNLLNLLLNNFISSPHYSFVFLDDGRDQLKKIYKKIEDIIEHLSGSLSAPDYYKRSENKRRGVKDTDSPRNYEGQTVFSVYKHCGYQGNS